MARPFLTTAFHPRPASSSAEFAATARGATLFFPIYTQSLKTLTHGKSTYKPNFKDELASHFKGPTEPFLFLTNHVLKDVKSRAELRDERKVDCAG